MNSKKTINIFIKLAVILLTGISIIGFLGKLHWLADLFSHFRIQYIFCLLFLGTVSIFFKQIRWGVASITVSLLLLLDLVRCFPASDIKRENKKEYKLISFNLNSANTKYDSVLQFLRKEDADFIWLMEVNERWSSFLTKEATGFRHISSLPSEGNFGIMLLSKEKPRAVNYRYFGTDLPGIEAVFYLEGKPVTLLGIHPFPPIGKKGSAMRNQHLSEVASHAENIREELILCGDLNLTPYSLYFSDFLKQSELFTAGIYAGVSPTWMKKIPFFAIPIDHVLTSRNIGRVDSKIGSNSGSDHSPVIATFCLSGKTKGNERLPALSSAVR